MSLLRYEPLSGVNAWSSDVFRLFDNWAANTEAATAWQPQVDILEFEQHFAIRLDLPGVPADAVEISLENKQLIVSGKREAAADEDVKRRHRERPDGEFKRTFRLPENADLDRIEARSENGVLHIQIEKRSPAQAVKIKVAA